MLGGLTSRHDGGGGNLGGEETERRKGVGVDDGVSGWAR